MPKPNSAKPDSQDTPWQGEVARWYDAAVGAGGTDFQRDLIFPHVLRLLGLKKGDRLLDVACGQGAFCRAADKLGASVTGVDASSQLIQLARQRSVKRIRYLVGDARQLDTLPADSFDAVACILAIQNIDPIEPVFAGCSRLLRPGGQMVIVMNHPSFRIPRQSGWGWDEQRKLHYRWIDHYLTASKIPIQIHPGSAPNVVAWTFHRPLQDYVGAMVNGGLLITALEEWPSHKASQPGPKARAENRARKEIPMFLALRAVKLRSP
ncbi:MAG: class I SAM-dependent methyltransferase [Chloroflexota bacterium]